MGLLSTWPAGGGGGGRRGGVYNFTLTIAGNILQKYYLLVLTPIGIAGNILSFLVRTLF